MLEIINNVKNFISKTFFSEAPETEPDAHEAKYNSEIQNILNLAWEGKLQDDDKKLVNFMLIQKFFSFLNIRKIKD